MKTKNKAWLNLFVLLLTLAVNALGGTGLINGSSQAEVSATYQTLITPAGFTFSIWSIIYILLLASVIAMIVHHKKPYYQRAIEDISVWFWLSSAFNMIWIVLFSFYQIGLSTIFIFAYLICLMVIVRKLYKIHQPKYWLLALSFALNTGWLFIASVVNVAAYLVQIDWQGFGLNDSIWALVILILSAVLAIILAQLLKHAAFTLPIAWAYYGINRQLTSTTDQTLLGVVAIIGVIVLVATALYVFYRNQYRLFPKEDN